MTENNKISAKALIPFGIFIGLYLATGLILQIKGVEMAFYQLPAPIAVFVAIITAFFIFEGSIEDDE